MASTVNSASQKRIYHFKWKDYNKYLVKRGDFSLFLDILDDYENELETLNSHKRGRKFHYPNCLFALCAVFRYLYRLPYRQLSGFLNSFSKIYNFDAPHYDTIRKRISKIKLGEYIDTFDFSKKEVSIAIDSSGLKLFANGEWLNKKHGNINKTRKGWLKIHFAVDVDNHICVAAEVTDETVGDSKKATSLINESKKKCKKIIEVLGDGAYDTRDIFNYCAKKGIDPIIKIRKNYSTKARGSYARAAVAYIIDSYGLKIWKKIKRYGRRWSVERTYSVFKQLFGEYVLARKFESQCKEIEHKIVILNHFLTQLSLIKV